MAKTKQLNSFLDDLSQIAYGRSRSDAISTRTCSKCGKNVVDFKDEISVAEYKITGWCQQCQDDFFEHGAVE